MTCVPDRMAAGVTVGFGGDGVMNRWYGVCCDYLLVVAHRGLHVTQMTSQKDIRAAPTE